MSSDRNNTQSSSSGTTVSQSRASTTSRTSAQAVTSKGLSGVGSGQNEVKNSNNNQLKIANAGGHEVNTMRLDNHEVLRIPPRERERVMDYNAPARFYHNEPHYFGYRVKSLPPRYNTVVHWGRTYYYRNNVYYRLWNGVYIVSRPPFGVCISRSLGRANLRALRFAYYHDAYYTYREIDANYRLIDEQNRQIARNNALLAAQNAALALNGRRAYSAYELANKLGLVQSYAYLNSEYYYEDGVFFVVNRKGQFEVIVPPAGALVSEIPDDYETIVMEGMEFYRVDDTVYRVTLVDGTPYVEVLGQIPANVAKRYGFYYY